VGRRRGQQVERIPGIKLENRGEGRVFLHLEVDADVCSVNI
jgi:hypothetical protein